MFGQPGPNARPMLVLVPLRHDSAVSLQSEIAEQPAVLARLLDEGWPEARTLAAFVASRRSSSAPIANASLG